MRSRKYVSILAKIKNPALLRQKKMQEYQRLKNLFASNLIRINALVI